MAAIACQLPTGATTPFANNVQDSQNEQYYPGFNSLPRVQYSQQLWSVPPRERSLQFEPQGDAFPQVQRRGSMHSAYTAPPSTPTQTGRRGSLQFHPVVPSVPTPQRRGSVDFQATSPAAPSETPRRNSLQFHPRQLNQINEGQTDSLARQDPWLIFQQDEKQTERRGSMPHLTSSVTDSTRSSTPSDVSSSGQSTQDENQPKPERRGSLPLLSNDLPQPRRQPPRRVRQFSVPLPVTQPLVTPSAPQQRETQPSAPQPAAPATQPPVRRVRQTSMPVKSSAGFFDLTNHSENAKAAANQTIHERRKIWKVETSRDPRCVDGIHPKKNKWKETRRQSAVAGAASGAVVGGLIMAPIFPVGVLIGGAVGGYASRKAYKKCEKKVQRDYEQANFQKGCRNSPLSRADAYLV
eukprot:Nitzschia sp. Nitz4//scaffold44_size153857//73327//74553//NITZ4_002724-RA/size153857-processed-gene-0.67-mRNA-1//1//CDS//3329552166//351//frame0